MTSLLGEGLQSGSPSPIPQIGVDRYLSIRYLSKGLDKYLFDLTSHSTGSAKASATRPHRLEA